MSKKLYVGNLSFSVTDQMLMETFSQYGQVHSAKVIIDRESGKSKGFAFVEMASDDDAHTAIGRLHGYKYEGRPLTVNEARPMVRREPGRGQQAFDGRPRTSAPGRYVRPGGMM